MLLLVSDLHVTDTAARSTFDVASFQRTVDAVLHEASSRAAENIQLVLLGDVFEILKSRLWLDNDVRPWEPPTNRHRDTVRAIVDRLIAVNGDFFTALRTIREAFPKVTLTYIMGNHDRPLNTLMGKGSRSIVRQQLGLDGGDALFRESFDDHDHSVLAQHGHHWDNANRYRGSTIAIGDAIVIDVLTRLPVVLAKHLGIDPDDPLLDFVHEVDNVIPQTPHRMAKWLADGMQAFGAKAATHLDDALSEVADELMARVAPYKTESAIGTWWVAALKTLAMAFGPMRSALKLPPGASAPPPLARSVKFDLDNAFRQFKTEYRYVVYGHTHIPDLRSIVTARGMTYYLNSGTWRRLHRAVDVPGPEERPYESSRAHSFIVIRHPREQHGGLPGYELRQSYQR